MSYSGTLFFGIFPWRWNERRALVDKDQSHVIGGFKATISNPNTSTEAKEHAAARLEELGESAYPSPPQQGELGSHQIAGYKATIHSSWDCLDPCPPLPKAWFACLQILVLRKKRRTMLARFWRRRVKKRGRASNTPHLPPFTINTLSGSSRVTKPLYTVRHLSPYHPPRAARF